LDGKVPSGERIAYRKGKDISSARSEGDADLIALLIDRGI
jgi:hypothetical protein